MNKECFMGKNFDQILNELRELGKDGASVQVTVVTNQDDLVASYATGFLVYRRAIFSTELGGGQSEKLASSPHSPLQYLFSDRKLDIDPLSPADPPSFGHTPRQPFSANAADKLGLSFLSSPFFGQIKTDPLTIQLTLLSWGNTTSTVELAPVGNLLYGRGDPLATSPTKLSTCFRSLGPSFQVLVLTNPVL
jgi:hypothetical protein